MTSIFVNGRRTSVSGFYMEYQDPVTKTFVPPEQPNPAPPVVSGSIVVTVYDDLTRDLLSGVTVTLEPDGGGEPLDTLETDASGLVTFSDVSAGTYLVRAVLDGYYDAEATATAIVTQEVDVEIEMSAQLTGGLRYLPSSSAYSAKYALNKDNGYLYTGRFYNQSENGILFQAFPDAQMDGPAIGAAGFDREEIIPGSRIYVDLTVWGDPVDGAPCTITALFDLWDGSGSETITHYYRSGHDEWREGPEEMLPNGTHTLIITPYDFLKNGYLKELVIKLNGRPYSVADIYVVPPEISGAATATIYNGLYTSNPLSGATVTLRPLAAETILAIEPVTRGSGRALLAGIEPGVYRIQAEKTGYHSATATISIDDQARGALISLVSTANSVGAVKFTVRNGSTSALLAHASVYIREFTYGIGRFVGTTAADGTVTFTGNKVDFYYYSVNCEGYSEATGSFSVSSGQTTNVSVNMTAGGLGSVSVTVRDAETSAVISGAAVTVSSESGLTWSGTTGGNGVATLTGVVGGTHTLRVSGDTYHDVTQAVYLPTGGTAIKNISLASGAATVAATAIDILTEAPLSGVDVTLFSIAKTALAQSVTNESGMAEFENLAPGSLYVRAAVEDYVNAVAMVAGVPGESSAVTLRLVPDNLTTNTGETTVAVSAGEDPVAGALVLLQPETTGSADILLMETTGVDGIAELGQVLANDYTLRVVNVDYPQTVNTVTILDGQTTALEATLQMPSGALDVTVVDTYTSDPLYAATVKLNVDGETKYVASTGPDGKVTITGIAIGSYQAVAELIGFISNYDYVTIYANDTSSVTIYLTNENA